MSLISKIKYSRLSNLYKATILPRANIKYRHLADFLPQKSRVLEVGCGNGGLSYLLQKNGYTVRCCDIEDHSFFPEIKPQLIDGKHLPYENKSFDVVLIITVLHHTIYQEQLLTEAIRVGKKVVVMEDIYTHTLGKKLIQFTDSLVNLSFAGHPHSNRSDKDWRRLFAAHNWQIIDFKYIRTLGYFRQVFYVLEAEK